MLETTVDKPRHRWSGFYQAHLTRPPHQTLLDAAARFAVPGNAIDLGYGSGNETLHLLFSGWNVLGIDREAEAAALLEQRIPPELCDAIKLRVAGFENLTSLPPADLIFAGFSIPFCHPSRFDTLWAQIRGALRPNGRFAGQLFGIEDDWAKNASMTFHSRSQVERLLEGFDVENLDEVCGPGRSFAGPKKWHVFHVIARKA